jgi:glycosyltransferase involved in cell wall biosynthesis
MMDLRIRLAATARFCLGRSYMLGRRLGLYDPGPRPVYYLSEKADWSIRQDALAYARAIEARHPGTVTVSNRPELSGGRIAHFGSQFIWQAWAKALDPATRQMITYFHGKPEDGPEMARHVSFFLDHLDRVSMVVTAAGSIEKRLLSWGVPRDKLVRVPLGIDLDRFRPPTVDERTAARARFGVPEKALCIGSFQKDGAGWGEGLEPKLIKGPDIFIDVVTRLARHFPIFVLLTGPARGYVKQGLEKAGIAYAHHVMPRADMVSDAFRALDLYIVASREEGGPKAVLESLASGVPLVSTRVGMAEDVIRSGINGMLSASHEAAELAELAGLLLADASVAKQLSNQGLVDIRAFAWDVVAETLYSQAYLPLLAQERPSASGTPYNAL